MSQIEKLKKRLLSKPKDFTMEELERLLLKLGCMTPHPQKHLKPYAINLAIEFLREIGRL